MYIILNMRSTIRIWILPGAVYTNSENTSPVEVRTTVVRKARAGRVDTISGNYTRHETEIFQLLDQIMEVRRLVFGSINLKTRVAFKIQNTFRSNLHF